MLLPIAKALCLLLSFVVCVVIGALIGSLAANRLEKLSNWLKRFM